MLLCAARVVLLRHGQHPELEASQAPRPRRLCLLMTGTGSTWPCDDDPKPLPTSHPMLTNILLPMLLLCNGAASIGPVGFVLTAACGATQTLLAAFCALFLFLLDNFCRLPSSWPRGILLSCCVAQVRANRAFICNTMHNHHHAGCSQTCILI